MEHSCCDEHQGGREREGERERERGPEGVLCRGMGSDGASYVDSSSLSGSSGGPDPGTKKAICVVEKISESLYVNWSHNLLEARYWSRCVAGVVVLGGGFRRLVGARRRGLRAQSRQVGHGSFSGCCIWFPR